MKPREGFALACFTVERRKDGWYYGLTNSHERAQYKGPYGSLPSVTLMVARAMLQEVERRQKRLASLGIPNYESPQVDSPPP